MAIVLDPAELENDILSTLDIIFNNNLLHTSPDELSRHYSKRYFNYYTISFMKCSPYVSYFDKSDIIQSIDLCNHFNWLTQEHIMRMLKLNYKQIHYNIKRYQDQNRYDLVDKMIKEHNDKLLLLSINKPYDEELYKPTLNYLIKENPINHTILNDCLNSTKCPNYFNMYNICKNKKEIKELKKTIDNNKQEHQKEIKELKETIDNNKQEHQKEIKELKETIDNNINFKIIIFLLFTYQIIFKKIL